MWAYVIRLSQERYYFFGGEAVSRWANKYVIGLTGNIAVGKSVVRQMMQHLGAYTIDADGLAHQAMAPGAPAYKPVVDLFGKFILDSEGRINRAMLSDVVFASPKALERLEAVVHPVVISAINTLVGRAKQPVVVIEAIKLLETDLADMVDTIWVVDASPETQLKRLMTKRRMSEDNARKRITAQAAQADKLARAQVVISNDGSVEDTWRQVQSNWKIVMARRGAVDPAPAKPAAPARPAAQSAAPAPAAATSDGSVTVKRGSPDNAEHIAAFKTEHTGEPVGRLDVMMAFGQKSYLTALDNTGNIVALLGWQVENLITRADEFYIRGDVPVATVVTELVAAIEEASRELQSEVGYLLLPRGTADDAVQSFVANGYESVTLDKIRVPAWREAVREMIDDDPYILEKKLRPDRVMKPI